MKYQLFLLKRRLEDLLMSPFIWMGRVIAFFSPLQQEYRVFYFFPFYHTGGAEKVHALVAQATGNEGCIIYFTRKSQNKTMRPLFAASGCRMVDISRYTDNKLLYFVNIIVRGVISAYINAQKRPPVVFNGQCNFGYKISPWIRSDIRQVELIHSFSNFSWIRIPFLPFISRTVMISRKKIEEHLEQYRKIGVPQLFPNRITYISNATEFEFPTDAQKPGYPLHVLYSGRATPEKRAHLVTATAERVKNSHPEITFTMAGDEFVQLRACKGHVQFKGNISDNRELRSLYASSHVLLVTSSTEGFPLAVIEAMVYGCMVIATPVGDIPYHVKQEESGYLFSDTSNETKIVEEAAAFLSGLANNEALFHQISEHNRQYAAKHFSFVAFAEAYKKIIYA